MAVYLVDFENVSSAGISGIQKLTKEDKVYIFYTVNASNMSFAAHLNLLSSPAEVVYYNVASGGKNALDFQLASFLGYLICQGKEKKFCIISNDRGFEYVKTFWERNGVAADISIFGAPSINRSLLAAEKPFAARIQQNVTAPAVQTAVEASSADEDKTAPAENIEAAKGTEEVSETAEAEQPAEKPAPKKRGRPKKQITEAAAEISEKTKEKSVKTTSKEAAMKSLRKAVKPLLEKAGIKSDGDVINIANLIKSADGKQQFYCKLTKSYGMEKGLTVYKAVRTEYTNLTKLVKP